MLGFAFGCSEINLALAAAGIILSGSKTHLFNQLGAVFAWALLLIPMLLRGLGMII